jgi:cholesterol transport system auxiliary component
MKNSIRLLVMTTVLSSAAMFSGCAAVQQQSASPLLFDLGVLPPPQNTAATGALPPLRIAEIDAPSWLDTGAMYYRLNYANNQQPLPYTASRWSMPPAQLFGQRLKARIGRAGGAVLSASDSVTDVPVLRIEVDDFTQIFNDPQQSIGRINARASVLDDRRLVAYRNFTREVPASTPDASGGARALADATDAIISDMMNWLAGLPLKK